ncbi:hypothetical protein KOW79_009217 [Hemibagrus wyckioides]|uniref:Uncharacterized protein n=1 Tax=Hemibagrus wyckioides TaxID=337641 RepID=A0A9D3NQC6_9TELE|nr:hypothetical protein KOW79_009217 [Hemibagrus wyckioides]
MFGNTPLSRDDDDTAATPIIQRQRAFRWQQASADTVTSRRVFPQRLVARARAEESVHFGTPRSAHDTQDAVLLIHWRDWSDRERDREREERPTPSSSLMSVA